MDEQDFPPRNSKRKRSLSESDIDAETQDSATGSPLLKKSMLREQQKLLSNAPDQIAIGALKEVSSGLLCDCVAKLIQWKFVIAPKAVSSTTQSKSTSQEDELTKPNKHYITADDCDYLEGLRARNIFNEYDREWKGSKEPKNLADLLAMLELVRPAEAPDGFDCDEFRLRLSRSLNDATLRDAFSDIFPVKQTACSDFLMLQSKQQWYRWIPICPDERPRLETPEPDYSIGLYWKYRDYPKSVREKFAGYVSPGMHAMAWIFLTVEVETITCHASRKNALNGAVAVNNILQLKKSIGREGDCYDTGAVFSIKFDTQVLSLSVHWVSRIADLESFHSILLKRTSMRKFGSDGYLQARLYVRNLRDWLEHDVGKQLVEDMKLFDAQVKAKLEANSCSTGGSEKP